jgi:hypothetical protein
MKTVANTSLALLFIAFSFNASHVLGQTTEPAAPASAKSDKAKKAADFAAKEKAMQDMSRSSGSGAVATPPAKEAAPYNKNKDKGKAAADEASDILTFKGSKPVDKNAKAVAPTKKSLNKMTPKELEDLEREVGKESKP